MNNRRDFLKSLGAGAATLALGGCLGLAGRRQPRRSNIVFVMTDDQGPWAFGGYPDPNAMTPHIDRLAGEGVRLDNYFVTTPVCSPSRASLMTGLYSTEVGLTDYICDHDEHSDIGLDEKFDTWPKSLRAAGYETALFGKWHLGSDDSQHPTRLGYREFAGWRVGGDVSKDPQVEIDGVERRVEGYTPDIITDLDVPRLKRMTREYLASVAGVDRNLGRLLELLKELRLEENTVVGIPQGLPLRRHYRGQAVRQDHFSPDAAGGSGSGSIWSAPATTRRSQTIRNFSYGCCGFRMSMRCWAILRWGEDWESMVIEEIIRQLTCAGACFDYYFYRTSAGAEVDLVLEGDFGLVAVEIKHTQSPDTGKLRALKDFVHQRGCRMGLFINNDLAPRLYDQKIVGLPFACL